MDKLPEELIWIIYTYIPRPPFIEELKIIHKLKEIEHKIDEYLHIFMGIYYGENIHEELYITYEELLSKYIKNMYPNYERYYDLPVFRYL